MTYRRERAEGRDGGKSKEEEKDNESDSFDRWQVGR